MTGWDTADQPPHILVLWGTDHTLTEMRGVGQAIYKRIFPDVTGKTLRQLAEVAGRTELVATGRVLPGAKETLTALAVDPRVHQAVLSGNLQEVSL